MSLVTRLKRDEEGAVAVIVALASMALVGFVALAIDVAAWYNAERRLQTAADAAALAAAFEIAGGKTAAQAAALAEQEAKKNGFTAGNCAVNDQASTEPCLVFNPPVSGFTTETKAVEVVLRETGQTYFSGMFLDKGPDITSRSIMSGNAGAGTYCVLALDGSAADALLLENNAKVSCGVAANSNNALAIRMENNATVQGNAYAVGTLQMKNNAVVAEDAYAQAINKANNAAVKGATVIGSTPALDDPYASFKPSADDLDAGCVDASSNKMSCTNNCTKQLSPGRYCYGWDVQNNATVTLNSGVYVIESKLVLKNNATIKEVAGGTGVTLIIKGDYAMDVGNNATWDFAAPTSGPYAGIAFHSLKTNNNALVQTFQNNAVLKLTGAVYAPSQKIYFENNASVSQTDCTQIVARLVDIRNNGNFGAACTGKGTKTIGRGAAIKTMK